jgi:hypothetical protein
MLQIIDQIKGDVEGTLRAEGPDGTFKTKLRDYCAHCCETAAKLMN